MLSDAQIQEKVNHLLIEFGIDGEFPVPVEKIAEKLGYKCHLFDPDEQTIDIAGAVNHNKKKIYINENDSPQRQLFTVAHEIGHIVLHGNNEDYIDYRRPFHNAKERAADIFAANLLMPEEVFRYQWKALKKNFDQLSYFFGVSNSAVGVRASVLGLD